MVLACVLIGPFMFLFAAPLLLVQHTIESTTKHNSWRAKEKGCRATRNGSLQANR
jgi:hypothetical protein